MKAALAAVLLLAASPAQALCPCLKCLTGLYQSFEAVSGSMEPAIEPGACAIVHKGAAVDRGSIIAFRHPVTADVYMFKRLIGLPGDVIEMKGGKLVLNGGEVPQSAVAPYETVMQPEGPMGYRPRCREMVPDGALCVMPRFVESLPNGVSYDVLDIDPGSQPDNAGPFTVPPNHIFVLGDNRDNSADSRFAQVSGGLGFIPAANILGPVVEISNP